MNERAALLIVLLVACVFTMNAHQFVSQFSSSSLSFVPSALAQTLPERSVRNQPVITPPSSPNLLQDVTALSFYVSHEAPDSRLLLQYQPYEERVLASLTKLMTAVTLLRYDIDWEDNVVILPDDMRGGSRTIIHAGDKVSVQDLWSAMLIGSDNDATAALVRHVSGNEAEFVAKMNNVAVDLGLQQTYFTEPTGLSSKNVSTAREFAMVARAAFRESKIRNTLNRAGQIINITTEDKQLLSTDQRIRYKDDTGNWEYITGKTGFTYAAGYTAAVLGVDAHGRETLVIILDSVNDLMRANDVSQLMEWAARQSI